MKKSFFSAKFLAIFVVAMSVLIIACIKEQGTSFSQPTTVSAREEVEPIPACFPGVTDGKDCNGDYVYVTDYINIPAYGNIPACNDVKVTYTVLTCKDKAGNLSINIGALTVYHSEDCPELENYLNQLPSAAQSTEYDKIEYIASIMIERKEILKLPIITPQLETNYVVQNCYQRCKSFKLFGKKKWASYKRLVCGEGCCIRNRKVTLNEAGQIVFYGKPTFQSTGDCYRPNDWENQVCEGELLEGDCKHSCTEIVRENLIPLDL